MWADRHTHFCSLKANTGGLGSMPTQHITISCSARTSPGVQTHRDVVVCHYSQTTTHPSCLFHRRWFGIDGETSSVCVNPPRGDCRSTWVQSVLISVQIWHVPPCSHSCFLLCSLHWAATKRQRYALLHTHLTWFVLLVPLYPEQNKVLHETCMVQAYL